LGAEGREFESHHPDQTFLGVMMTCKGYDPKAVKVSKSIKRLTARHVNAHKRGSMIRDYVRMLEEQSKSVRKEK
jgi:hypothetical protein